MSAFQVMPDLSPEEYEALNADIQKRGIQVPILIDEDGSVLDGHHRQRIAEELGITCDSRLCPPGLSKAEKIDLALSLNLHRRHLSREQRRELIEKYIKAAPEKSDRQIAKATGVSPTTVGTVRAAAEADGDVSKLDTRTDSKGRQQPTTKPRTSIAPSKAPEPDLQKPTPKPVAHGHGHPRQAVDDETSRRRRAQSEILKKLGKTNRLYNAVVDYVARPRFLAEKIPLLCELVRLRLPPDECRKLLRRIVEALEVQP